MYRQLFAGLFIWVIFVPLAFAITLTNEDAYLLIDDSLNSPTHWYAGGEGRTGYHFFNDSYWIRIGGGGGEHRVSDLLLLEETEYDNNGDGLNEYVMFRYRDQENRFEIENNYDLSGRNGNEFFLSENILITNTSGLPLEVYLFRLAKIDLDVGLWLFDERDYDTVRRATDDSIRQESPWGSKLDAFWLNITPNRYEFSKTSSISTSLSDAFPTNLSLPISQSYDLFDPEEWAWQWNTIVPTSETLAIGIKNRVTVPEPSPIALLLVGTAILLFQRKRWIR